MPVALEFHQNILAPSLINGLAISSLYALVAVALVLTYRMSRSVAFVHGGIATGAAFLYWFFATEVRAGSSQQTLGLPKIPSLLGVMVLGALTGLVFGSVVMGRMAKWPRLTVTTFSLGGMLLIAGIMGTIWRGVFERVPSPFGEARVTILDMNVNAHQIASMGLLVVIVAATSFVLARTRLGVYIRAIADDVEAGEIVGIPVRRVAIGVWSFAGALAALGGALVVPMTTLTELAVLFVLLRSLAGAILGGFDSLPLALAGALIFGLVESVVGGGVFGTVSSGAREVVLMGILFSAIVLLARRKGAANLLEA